MPKERKRGDAGDSERLGRIEELQRAMDEAELSFARLKTATKQAKEALAELRFRHRRLCLNLPEDEEPADGGAPLFDLPSGTKVDVTTGEVVQR